MIELQFLNKILEKKDYSLIILNGIDENYFDAYKKEFKFIKSHYDEYQQVPDDETFMSRFPKFDLFQVLENDKYLLNALEEEKLYRDAAPVLIETSNILKAGKSKEAVQYLQSTLPALFRSTATFKAIDLIGDAEDRYIEYIDKIANPTQYFIPTGNAQIDKVIGGFDLREDLVLITARTGIGKSWRLIDFAKSSALFGKRAGFYSGEMKEAKLGYRFDTLVSNISNFKLSRGIADVQEAYKKHIDSLKNVEGHIFVVTPKELRGPANATKLKAFVAQFKLDILYIDQASLLTTNQPFTGNTVQKWQLVAEEIKNLQEEIGIPICMAIQLNRTTEKGSTPDSTAVALSDRFIQDATWAISIQSKDNNRIHIDFMKTRDTTGGETLVYVCDIDTGKMEYAPEDGDALDKEEDTEETKPKRHSRKRNNANDDTKDKGEEFEVNPF